MMKLKIHWQILIALFLAILAGMIIHVGANITGHTPDQFSAPFMASCKFIGQLFFNALKMIVVPLIVPSIICGMMGLGADKHFKRLGLKTLTYYLSTGLIAVITGLLIVNLIQPGHVDKNTAEAILDQAQDADTFLHKVEGKTGRDFLSIFIRMIPPNVLDAATNNGQLLGVIFFSLLFGFFISRLPERYQNIQKEFWESILRVVTLLTDFIIKFAPIGVFALISPVIIETGISAVRPLLLFFITVLLALGIHSFVTLPLLLKLFRLSPSKHYRATAPALLTAFSTASSASTLPVTLEAVEKEVGVPKRISSFTLPLGATVNMDGTALYECVVVIFIAQFYGVLGSTISLATQLTVVLLALLTSVGVAGIPSASLVAIAIILGAVGLPVEAVGIVLVVDRILDMCRTSVNVLSDTCGAAIIAKSEGEDLYMEEKSRKKNAK
ncbi:MAG: cation:dicarboxylase symporter family transporter [Kiritimatiellae bacterium]|nr:cation:dicarboxylase symporter family transporter [Kiritimatiellia bacterium]